MLPLSGGEMRINFGIPGRQASATRAEDPVAAMRWISAGYFETMGIRLVRGRVPADSDTADAPPVVLVNEALARRYWPGDDAIGRKVDVDMQEATIVGIVADVRHGGPAASPGAEMYLPYTQFPPRGGWLVLRTAGDPALLAPALRTAVRQVDPSLPLSSVAPMSRLVERSIAQPRFIAALLSGFALLALVLTLGGVYSVLSFACSRRTREIGVRMALGAERGAVVWMVLRHSLVLVVAGLALGVALALPLARALRSLLFGVGPSDPVTFGAMALLVVTAGLAASYLPARRAALVDPVVALRED
jgi:putative ABC transport system permease protein